MSIAMFMDVDQMLTKDPVQMRLATMLGVADELRGVENAFREEKATNAEFNDTLVPLFRSKRLTLQFVKDHFHEIALQPWAKSLLSLRETTRYLISSGPSYYVRTMAEKWDIPPEQVLCSEYIFDEEGILVDCIDPVSLHGKASFVRDRITRHEISIGLGDNLKQDSVFLSYCTIPILTTPTEDFVTASKLESVVLMVKRLAPMFPILDERQPLGEHQPRVFIGSSAEALPVAEAVQFGVHDKAEAVIWTQAVFTPGQGILDSLVKMSKESDFAVLVFSPDDVVKHREEEFLSVRDNVLFELGLFMGHLGPTRTFILHPRDRAPKVPSDLAGIVPLTYTYSDNLYAAVGPACTRLKDAIKALGRLKY